MKIFILLLIMSLSLLALDINHANLKEFQTLKGIGSKTAQKIIDYRTKYGCFTSVEDLLKVKGIGKKTLDKNKKVLEVQKCEVK